jgi:hypothetical protein
MEDATPTPKESQAPYALRVFGKGTGIAFAWQDKRALNAIRERLDGNSKQPIALAVYLALTEIASDKQSDCFVQQLSWIAGKAGTSIASVKRVLQDVEAIPLVKIDRPKLKGPATYTLLAMAQAEPTIAQSELTIAQDAETASRATIKESKNNPIEETEKKVRANARPSPQPDDEWLLELSKDATYAGLDVQREFGKLSRWCKEHRQQPSRKRFVNWLNRADRPMQVASPSAPDHSKGF